MGWKICSKDSKNFGAKIVKQVLIKKGQIMVENVPAPIAGEGEVLVQVYYSCISAGTEIASVKSSGVPLYRKALKDRQNIKKVMNMLRTQGFNKMISKVKAKVESANPTGYSATGIVLEVGNKIKDIKQGDRVACAGAGIANHAEFITVPRNLVVKVPENLPIDIASTVTLGSIAMQGIHRADPKLGEYVAVIGLGILGQLTVQMLKANGCKVIGVDVDQKRINLALSLGIDKSINSVKNNAVDEVVMFTNGYGADSVIITASTEKSEVINEAMEMCRKKGKVVIVGSVGLNIKREEFYKKELDVLISTSYGPGRYDEKYESKSVDYPYAYVRWTENRNMQEYLRLLEDEKINIKPLIEEIYPIEKAAKAYEELKTAASKPLMVLLKYNKEAIPERKIVISKRKITKDKLNIALIGAGNFAKAIHLPNLQKLKNIYNIYAAVSKTGSNAKVISKQYGASYATTDFREVLKDKDVDMVIITTRHNLHAQIAIESAKSGKAVFVEKPMAVNAEELKELVSVLGETKVPFMVGFNRRFSSYARKIKEIIKDRQNPMIINYRMNAGFIPIEHWVHTEEGGGRNIGEACHIYDLFNFFTESKMESINAFSIDPKTEQYMRNDNFITTIKYIDGSVCNLVYTALGSKEVSKEQMEIYFDGKIISLNDYKEMRIYGNKVKELKLRHQDKGQLNEIQEFSESIKNGSGYPIPLWQLIQATNISFEVEKQIAHIK